MITREDIYQYHAKLDAPPRYRGAGIELELFAIDKKNHILPYHNDSGVSVEKILKYLTLKHGWKEIDPQKTFGIEKNGRKITIEPGGQIEFVSHVHERAEELMEDLGSFLGVIKDIQKNCGIEFLDIAHFPCGTADNIPTIEKDRYKLMEKYFATTGKLGREMMNATTSLQISFDYLSVEDLEEKVNRLLLVKPIIMFLASNSRISNGKDSGYRSYREIIWQDTDLSRCGTPGPDSIWNKGRWKLDDYIEKTISAPVMFDVAKKKYTYTSHEPFLNYMNETGLDGYIFHNNTIYTDIRVKQYAELRYMDNPGIALVPGLSLLLYSLVYEEEIWNKFKQCIPYQFSDVPKITNLLNEISENSISYWNTHIKNRISEFLSKINEAKTERYIAPLLEKTKHPDKDFEAVKLFDCAGILNYHKEKFVRNLHPLIST